MQIPTKLKKQEAFNQAADWLAETANDANKIVQLSDKARGKIIAKPNVSCDALKLGSGYGQNQRLDFTLVIDVSDNLVKMSFNDVLAISPGSYDSARRPSSKQEMDAATAQCLAPLKQSLEARLRR